MKTDIEAGDLVECIKNIDWDIKIGPKIGDIFVVSRIIFNDDKFISFDDYSFYLSKYFRKIHPDSLKRATKQWDWNNQPVKVE